MSYEMTPELSREANAEIRKDRISRYKKLGFQRESYEKEIVKGCKLSWNQVKAKSFALSCYREETGIKPVERKQVDHDISGSLMAAVASFLSAEKNDRSTK